jgi:hypothetical protein
LLGTIIIALAYTDYKNLEYFITTKIGAQRQATWVLELARTEFDIGYCRWLPNSNWDALSWVLEDYHLKGN